MNTFDYEYIADGSREKMITPWGTWTYAYNEIGAPDQMTSPAGTVNYEYFDDGALASREVLNTSGNSVAFTSYEYNSAGLLKKLENKTSSNGSQLSLFDMTASTAFDGAFNLKSLAATVTGVPTLSGTLGWDYDTRDRVTNEAGSRPGLMGSASYDGAGNLLTKGANGWTYNSNNQVTPSSGQWAYDGNGNATKFRARDCTFDPFDRMTTMREGNNWSVGYTYRADGLMATRAKTIYIYNEDFGEWMAVAETPTYFYHDGGEPIVELSLTNQVKAINVRGPDGLVARKHGSTWIYYTFDQQGSVSQRLNSNGVVQSTSAYSAYGSESNTVSPTDPFGFCAQWGYWLDRDTGLYLCQARWYDPVTGRWVNRDPIGYSGGANLYGYCGGGPVGGADPSGLARLGDSLALGFANLLSKSPPWLQNLVYGSPVGAAATIERLTQGPADEIAASNFNAEMQLASECSTRVSQLVQTAREIYPKLANLAPHRHHVDPKYLGGDPKGPTVLLNPAYHQMITNAFRSEWPYGRGYPSPIQHQEIMDKVYERFPINVPDPTILYRRFVPGR